MRNFNTSFVANVVSRFGEQAAQVLDALSNPATSLMRLLQSIFQAMLAWWARPGYRPSPLGQPGMSGTGRFQTLVDSLLSSVIGKAMTGHGIDYRDCPTGQTQS